MLSFKNIGLVIIDEEQRFGVAQKEQLKEQYPFVDIFTLSAPPRYRERLIWRFQRP